MKFKTILVGIASVSIFITQPAYSSYTDDGLSRLQAIRYTASTLFNIPMASIDDPVLGVNYNYNDWGENPGYLTGCRGYDGGHSGIDMQTKDVAGAATATRKFYAVSEGEVITAGGDDFNTVAIYDEDNNRTVIYLHAEELSVNIGDTVSVGDAIGVQGDTGIPGAEHVHLEARSGRRTGSACGATTTVDVVPVIYDYVSDIAERRVASSVLPPLMTSVDTHLLCGSPGQAHIEFEILTYSPIQDLDIVVHLIDSSFNSVKRYPVSEHNISSSGTGGFRLYTPDGVRQNIFKVEFDTTDLTQSEYDRIAYLRVYTGNNHLQNIPTLKGHRWLGSAYTLFIPKIINDNMGGSNSEYSGTNQDYAQRYIRIDSSCVN